MKSIKILILLGLKGTRAAHVLSDRGKLNVLVPFTWFVNTTFYEKARIEFSSWPTFIHGFTFISVLTLPQAP